MSNRQSIRRTLGAWLFAYHDASRLFGVQSEGLRPTQDVTLLLQR